VEAHPAEPGGVEARDFGCRRIRVQQGDAAIAALQVGERIEHRRMVGAVAGRLDEHAAGNAEKAMQPQQQFLRRIMGREGAVGRKREFVRRAEDVEMRIAASRRKSNTGLGGVRVGRRTCRLRTQTRSLGHGDDPLELLRRTSIAAR
jgi:hypothetical protein